jgi:hypothetical protein
MNPEEFANEDARRMVEFKLNAMTTHYGSKNSAPIAWVWFG